MLSPTAGSAITMSGSPARYTYTGAAATYRFKIMDAHGSSVNRTVTLANPIAFSFTNLNFPYAVAVGCDSLDMILNYYTNGGTNRPNYQFDFWVNSNTAAGSPTITYTGKTSFPATMRIPTPNYGANTVVRVTDSCGNTYTANLSTLSSLAFNTTNSSTDCNKINLRALYSGLKTPVVFNLDSAGTIIKTMTQNNVVRNGSYADAGIFSSLSPGIYTVTATDSCGKIFTRSYTVASPSKSIPSAAASLTCVQTSVDSTTSFRISSTSWSLPATVSIVSGPATYTHTNIAGVIDPNLTYPMSRTLALGNTYVELSNMPMGTYRIAVLDACGWTDTVPYVIDASNIVKINLAATVTPGCLDANAVTVNGNFSCYRSETTIALKNSAGTTVGSTGVTGSPISFTTYNLPSGNYTINLTGVSPSPFASGGSSILTHLQSGRPSMVIPVSFALYTAPSVSVILRSLCPNSTVGSLVTRAVGVTPYNYELLAPLTNSVLRTSQTDSVFNGVALSDSFRVRVTDACGNISVSSIASFAGVARNVGATSSLVSCLTIGGTATLRADSIDATTYVWSGSNGFSANGRVVTKTMTSYADSGTYKVVSTNIAGCKDSTTVNLTIKPNAGTNQTICQNTTATLTAVPTTGGVWSAKSGNPSTATITTPTNSTTTVTGLSVAGTYNFIWTAYTGCTDTIAVTVNALPTVSSITGTNIVTIGSTSTLSNTTSGGVWSSLNTNIATISGTGLVTGVVAGAATINYRVTNANSCNNTATYNVTVNPKASP